MTKYMRKKKTRASVELTVVKSIHRMRSRRMKFCVQRGLGALPSTSSLWLWIATCIACDNTFATIRLRQYVCPQEQCCAGNTALGITPAYAGKSIFKFVLTIPNRDHPCICGEKIFKGESLTLEQGAPPRMRGKVDAAGLSHALIGITPAYAGKSHRTRRTCGTPWDHPRVCGEKHPYTANATIKWGSPPHMRGKDVLPVRLRGVVGITPAYAGKSFLTTARWLRWLLTSFACFINKCARTSNDPQSAAMPVAPDAPFPADYL